MIRPTVLLVVWLVAVAAGACASNADSPGDTASGSGEGNDMQLTSPEFEQEQPIPEVFTCDGEDVSPPLEIGGTPEGTVSLALVMDDPDAPSGTWDHWIAYDIEPQAAIPRAVTSLGTPGTNSWNRTGYGGPCPPGGTHRYVFTVYALDTALGLEPGVDKRALLDAIDGHILDQATLIGTYSR